MKEQKNLSDNELLHLMRAGDEEALGELYQRRYRSVYRFALHMSGSGALAEDIAQEVFLVLIRDNHGFNSTNGSLNAFLLGVARNLVLRRLQRELKYVSLEEDLDGEVTQDRTAPANGGPLDALSRNETIESVRRAVLALPEHYREVVVLCDLQEMSYVEAAQVLGCAVGTVRSRLHRARAFLIEKLRPAQERDLNPAAVKTVRCLA